MGPLPAPKLGVAGKLYIGAVFLAGTAAVADSVYTLSVAPIGYQWLLLAALTWSSGPFAVKVPAIAATISVSEAFIFTMILMFGGAPATLTVAADGLVSSWYRKNRQARRLLFNFAEPAITTWVAAKLFFWMTGASPLAFAPSSLGELFLPVVVLASSYFFLNSWMTALAVTAETGTPPHRVWQSHVVWLSLNYFGGASIALLLALNMRQVTLSSLGAVVPLLVILYVTFKNWAARLDDTTTHLKRLNELYMATVESLAMAIDAKDQVTHGHIRRVQTYSVGLAGALGLRDEIEIKAIEAAALLHDMGKLAIPDYILNKPGKLTASEYETMELHAPAGAEILSAVHFPYPIVPIVRHHHENWDGTGYPDGISGEAIPIGARILSVIDCYDALTSDRPYRRALSHDDAVTLIQERRGTMYDPAVVDRFVEVHDKIRPEATAEPPRPTALSQLAPSIKDLETRAAQPPQRPPTAAAAERTGRVADPATLVGEVLRLCNLTDTLAGHATIDDTGELVARSLRRVVPASLVVLYRADRAAEQLTVAHASGHGGERLSDFTLPLGEGVSGWVATNRTTMTNADPALDFADRLGANAPAMRSTLSTPLIVDDALVGVLTLYAEVPAAFSENHRQLVEIVARQVAQMVRRVTDVEDSRATDLTDPLTGLPNGRYLEHLLASRGFSHSRFLESLGVLSFGVAREGARDRLPATPDEILRVATAVYGSIRAADLLFRDGDDEIVVLMPSCDPGAGELVSQRVVSQLSAEATTSPAVAIGFACAPFDGESLGALVESAKSRMLGNLDERQAAGGRPGATRRRAAAPRARVTASVGGSA